MFYFPQHPAQLRRRGYNLFSVKPFLLRLSRHFTLSYLIVLSVGVFASTFGGPHTLFSKEDVAGVTHTRFHTGTTAACGGLPSTRVLTGVCTRLIVAVSGTVQS